MTYVFFILIPTMHLGFSYIFLKGHKASLESFAMNWDNFTLDRNIFKLISVSWLTVAFNDPLYNSKLFSTLSVWNLSPSLAWLNVEILDFTLFW